MTTIEACDPRDAEELLRTRHASGLDQYDEVWDGVYVMAPLANDEHQDFATQLAGILLAVIGWLELGKVRAGVNVSDRVENWIENFRVPDVALFLKDGAAQNHGTHWFGGPDWGCEIVSPGDRSRQKLDFYAKIGTRELLIVDRDPWSLELYALKRKKLRLVGRSTPKNAKALVSTVLPLSFRLVSGKARPVLEVVHSDGKQSWRI
jgi:Uma2 family endonuclease